MKVGIDSYCYHRYFGEVYPDQEDPGVRWTFHDFVNRAAELEVDGVSLESCFFESLEPGYLDQIKGVLDDKGLDRVLAWGHPDGLEAGRNREAHQDMNSLITKARLMGASIMRIVASSLQFRYEPHEPQIEAVVGMLRESVKIAEEHGVVLAGGQTKLAGKIFSIGHLGWVSEADMQATIDAPRVVLPKLGHQVPTSSAAS